MIHGARFPPFEFMMMSHKSFDKPSLTNQFQIVCPHDRWPLLAEDDMTESPIHVLYDILLLVVLIIMNSHRMLRTRRYIFIFGLVGTFIFQIKQLQHQKTESNRSAPLSRRVESTASISQKDDPTHDHNKPPVMHTFYEPDPKGYCCGMLEVRMFTTQS